MYQKKLKALDELDAFGCVFAIMAFDELNWAFVLDPQLGAIANRDRDAEQMTGYFVGVVLWWKEKVKKDAKISREN